MTTCVAVVTVLSLAACSNLENELTEELEIRGFTDITANVVNDDIDTSTYDSATFFANVGTCRVVLQFVKYPIIAGEEWTLVERSSQGSDYDLIVPNPTVEKLKLIDYFTPCFESDDTQSSQESQE